MIERQTIVTWYAPAEKLPPEDIFVVVTISGRQGHTTYEHALMLAIWFEDEGWIIDGIEEGADVTVHAWCDLEPYGG